MSIKQWEDETTRSYITHFNKEALSIDEADDKILVTAFINGLQNGKFLFSLYKKDPKTMTDMLYRATKYMNVEDVQQEDARQERGRKMTRTGDRQEDKCSKPPTRRFTNFTPLTAPIN